MMVISNKVPFLDTFELEATSYGGVKETKRVSVQVGCGMVTKYTIDKEPPEIRATLFSEELKEFEVSAMPDVKECLILEQVLHVTDESGQVVEKFTDFVNLTVPEDNKNKSMITIKNALAEGNFKIFVEYVTQSLKEKVMVGTLNVQKF